MDSFVTLSIGIPERLVPWMIVAMIVFSVCSAIGAILEFINGHLERKRKGEDE